MSLLPGSCAALLLACGTGPSAADVPTDSVTSQDSEPDASLGDDAEQSDVAPTDAGEGEPDVPTPDGEADSDVGATDVLLDSDADMPTEWEPPFDGFGVPGWRESTEPLCRPDDNASRGDIAIWADRTGVFLASHLNPGPPAGHLRRNDGTGWVEVDQFTAEELRHESIREIVGGPHRTLWFFGLRPPLVYDPALAGFTGELPEDLRDVTVLADGTALGLIGDAPGLIASDGESWAPYPGEPLPFEPRSFYRVWTDGETIFLGGENGTVVSRTGDGWTVHSTGTLSPIVSLWGRTAAEVYAGTDAGELLGYDGADWTSISWEHPGDGTPCQSAEDSVRWIWGAESTVFFAGNWNFGRIADGEVELISWWGGRYEGTATEGTCFEYLNVLDVAGVDDTNVFFVLAESDEEDRTCLEYVVHWDGDDFHWF